MSDEVPVLLARIAAALERLAPPAPLALDLAAASAWVWRPKGGGLAPVDVVKTPPLDLLLGMDTQKNAVMANLRAFAGGRPANNVLLWGARGTGKSALAKSSFVAAAAEAADLRLIEISREDLARMGEVLAALQQAPWRVVLFIDDLSFEGDEAALHALKPALEGSLTGRAPHIMVIATANRRHLLGRDPRENSVHDLHWGDTAEDRLAISDRFGLWLGFHPMDQDEYLAIVGAYGDRIGLSRVGLEAEAIGWALARGARSGRTAYQFITHKAAEQGLTLSF